MNALVSIIIPVYNVVPFIKESLDSVINQTYRYLEIIVIDDGSTDGSEIICDEYSTFDSRITVLHQSHKGVSAARNAGLDVATGEYIAFLDPDDAYDPDFVQCMVDTILMNECDIVICKYKVNYTTIKMNMNDGRTVYPLCKSGEYNRTQALNELINGKLHFAVWNKIYKKKLWNTVRFLPELKAGSDHVASIQVFYGCNSAYVIDNPLYLYRSHQNSISKTFSNKNIECQILARSLVAKYLKSHCPVDFSEEQIKRYEESRLSSMTFYYFQSSDKIFSENLKKQIINFGEEIGIENCGYKTRVKYYMICFSPQLLMWACKIYLKIKMIKKNFRK